MKDPDAERGETHDAASSPMAETWQPAWGLVVQEGVAVGLAFEAAALKVLESPALLLRRDSGEVTLAIGNANMGVGSRHGGYCSGYC
jgi:hypothetical protein